MKHRRTQVFYSFLFFSGIIFLSTYTANLASHLTLKVEPTKMSVNDFSGNITMGCKSCEGPQCKFLKSQFLKSRKRFECKEYDMSHSTSDSESNTKILNDLVNGKITFFTSDTNPIRLLASSPDYCDKLRVLPVQYYPQWYAGAVRHGSPWKKFIDAASIGLYGPRRHIEKWERDYLRVQECERREVVIVKMGVENMLGIFATVGIVAIICCLTDCFVRSCNYLRPDFGRKLGLEDPRGFVEARDKLRQGEESLRRLRADLRHAVTDTNREAAAEVVKEALNQSDDQDYKRKVNELVKVLPQLCACDCPQDNLSCVTVDMD